MSRFLLLNFEDFGLNQDIKKTIQSHTPFCICCLQINVPLVNLFNCSHASFLDIYFKPELNHHNYVACHQCHSVLIKIRQFKEQVESSVQQLQSESFNIADIKTKSRLNIHKTVDIILSPTSGKKAVFSNDSKSQSVSKNVDIPSSEQNDTKCASKLKNIQKALEIINNNGSGDNLTVLNMGLEFIKASALANLDKKLSDFKEPKQEEISIKGENGEFDRHNNELESNNVKRDENAEKALVKMENRDKPTQNRLYVKIVTLTKEELMRERYLKTQSVDYLKRQYKCDHCIIGFNYKDNLNDHMKRKHTLKSDGITCDICSQVYHTIGTFYTHNTTHFTRYECVSCKKRYPEYGDALKHYRIQHGFRKSKCKFCDFSVDSKSKLKIHIQKCHNKFPCEVCGVSLASLNNRKYHKMVKHEKKCSQCDLHFTTSNEFCEHMKRCHTYCVECDVRFKSWYACIAHMRFNVAHADKRKRLVTNNQH